MKNLKKVLALVLVIAMVMGFAVSASATEFSDAEEIAEQNETAVGVLTSLNVINGYTDGTFKPTESVSRAEVAKMIAVAFNNGDESINSLYANVDVQGNLSDVYSGYWAEGYIKYCYATGIMQGYPDGTFKPDADVTGNELCQVMLNILGYEIDTTNTPWATAVMAKSNAIGLLKNVSTPVGSACPRQEAAQIIYNSLLLPIQVKNAVGALVDSEDTILTKYLGATKESVVVTGNEYADLNSDSPLDEGKTQVEGGATYTWTTGRDDIGESYVIYVKNGTVVYSEDSGLNTVEELTEGVYLSRAVSMDMDADTEDYVNFGEGTTYTSSEYKIHYVIDLTATQAETYLGTPDSTGAYANGGTYKNGTYEKEIKPGSALTDVDMTLIKNIFYTADLDDAYVIGEVYVGTQSLEDISDEISYRAFVAKYIESEEGVEDVTYNENGNYTKVIDNDGDGVAEYVLKTAYTMATVNDIASNGTYTLSNYAATDETATVSVKASAMSAEEELAEGDVIIYALIDGVYYSEKAESISGEVASIDYKNYTVTVGETTYEQSEIENRTTMLDNVYELTKGENYVYYLDKYDNVRAFIEYNYGEYYLLTEMYRDTTTRNNLITDSNYTVEATDTEGTTANYSVATVRTGSKLYSTGDDFYLGQGNGLVKATSTSYKPADYVTSWTNVVDGSVSDSTISMQSVERTYRYNKTQDVVTDIYDLTDGLVDEYTTNSDGSKTQTVVGTGIKAKQTRFDFTNAAGNADYVNITSSTVVYIVTGQGENAIQKVEVVKGYANIPAIDESVIHAVYAVANTTYSDADKATYPVADVLVIEITGTKTTDFAFGYQKYNKTVASIGSDGTLKDVDLGVYKTLGFYDTQTTRGEEYISGSNWSNYVTAGRVFESPRLNYVEIQEYEKGVLQTASADIVTVEKDTALVYTLSSSNGIVSVNATDGTALSSGDEVIVVYADTNHRSISYIIRVETDKTSKSYVGALVDEYDEIANAYGSLTVTYDSNVTSVKADGTTVTSGTAITTYKVGATATLEVTAIGTVTVKVDGTAVKANSDGKYVVEVGEKTTVTVSATDAYEAYVWVGPNKDTIQVALKKNGTFLTQEEYDALGLEAGDFSITVQGTTTTAKQMLPYCYDSTVEGMSVYLQLDIGEGTIPTGSTYQLNGDTTAAAKNNISFSMSIDGIDEVYTSITIDKVK